MPWSRSRFAALVVGVMALGLGASSSRAGFLISDLGVLGPGESSQGFAINSSGAVAGIGTLNLGLNRAIVGGSGSPSNLGTLTGGRTSTAFGINDSGLVAGDGEVRINGQFQTHAFRSGGNGSLIDFGVMGADVASTARGINTAGHVVGWSTSAGGRTQAFVAAAPNALMSVEGLDGVTSKAFAINDAGSVVGEALLSGAAPTAFRVVAGQLANLGTLPGATGSSARAINEGGDVVGYTTGSTSRAFLSLATGEPMIDLGLLPFGISSEALGINEQRHVVGSVSFGSESTAFIWLPFAAPGGRMFDLNSLILPGSGWQLLSAQAINESSQITGYGFLDGELRGFRLDPIPGQRLTDPAMVPEPSSITAFLLGLTSLLVVRSKRTWSRSRARS